MKFLFQLERIVSYFEAANGVFSRRKLFVPCQLDQSNSQNLTGTHVEKRSAQWFDSEGGSVTDSVPTLNFLQFHALPICRNREEAYFESAKSP
jgi:hypothetical protein